MRLLRLAALLLPLPAAAAPPQAVLAIDSATRWVPFDLTPGNQLRFRMTVNGRPATAILDTGVSYTVTSRAFAATIGLRPAVSGRAMAIGGAVPLGWAAVEEVAFGGLARAGGRVAVADLSGIATGTADPVEVLVGADLLGAQALDIDYDTRRFRLLPSGRLPFRGTSVPLGLARDSGVFVSEVSVGGRRLRPVIVDTGDGSAVTIASEAWATVRPPAVRETTAYAVGLGGAIETDLTVLPAVRLGSLTARNVEVRVERGGGFSHRTGTVGRIGSALLQRYRVLLDPLARRMVLSPGRTADREPLRSTSGLLVAYEKSSLRVLHVMRHSPAATGGWRAGERICRIDGAPLPGDYLSSPLAAWPADTPGRVVRLALCDGGGERTLTLARFY
ncbi:Aspartyl protease [Sphingomonas guangdongensis]|uniref:Aspartyl protease n=1 Tax=Sphingomonas guangdongensis TaxID=1141890 RepID=A0A285QBA9_9SPHN|nr:aspartyl protease family protein [Sphingomonas guangdongensis]SOB78764.1 Aspartyl protease [Sphingomonas guangdongensis]